MNKKKNNEEPDGFGHIIAKIRRSKKIPQGDFAKSISITQTYLSQIENNKEIPSPSLLKKIGEGLGIPPGAIMMFSMKEKDVRKDRLKSWRILHPIIMNLIKAVFLPEE